MEYDNRATKEQKEKADEIIKNKGIPKNIFYDGILKCLFLEMSWGLIGIEIDGYSHM